MNYPIKSDSRYTITQERCGHTRPRFVLRWCDAWVGSFSSYSAAVVRAVGHKAARDGALVIEEIPAVKS